MRGFDDACGKRLAALANRHGALAPEADLIGEALLDLRCCQAGPVTDVSFAQLRVDDDFESLSVGHDPRGFVCTAKVARVDRFDRLACQELGELPRLLPTARIQRRIGVSLKPAVAVPVGLTVAREDQRGHAD